jgi:hypothetical protein
MLRHNFIRRIAPVPASCQPVPTIRMAKLTFVSPIARP